MARNQVVTKNVFAMEHVFDSNEMHTKMCNAKHIIHFSIIYKWFSSRYAATVMQNFSIKMSSWA